MTGDQAPLRLLTFNTLFKGDVRPRLRALGTILRRERYDVVCLQELMYRRNARLLRRVAGDAYPHHAYTGAVALHGGLMLLSRWPLRHRAFTRFPAARPVRPELLMRKGVQVAVVALPAGDCTVVNTHLSANRDDDWSPGNRYTRVRRGELDGLAAVLSAVDPRLPLVVLGDFNLPRSSRVLAEFAVRQRLDDAMGGRHEPTYRPTPQFPSPPAFDRVFLRAAPTCGLTWRARLVFQDAVPLADGRQAYLSDHYGIETELTLTGRGAGSAAGAQ
jgi:endonuclease/exonuclease/phosphatase family metal-dependent hydrolase